MRSSGIAVTAVALVATALPSAATAVEPEDGLIASYDFARTSGTSVPNSASSGVGQAEVVGGSDAQWTGDSLELTGGAKTDGSANWVRLPDDLLASSDSATITVETRLDASMKSSYNFLWSIGSDATDEYWFSSVRDASRTAITTSGGGGEFNARADSSLEADRWNSITSVLDGDAGTLAFYVDGELMGETDTTLTPADVSDQSMNTIGRSPYPDQLYAGEVSTFRVYDRALSADEVVAVSETDAQRHDEEILAAAQSIVDGIADVTFTEAVKRLPDYGGAVSWSSSDPAITVAADGRTATAAQLDDEPVQTVLTATATVRGQSVSREVPVTIRPEVGAETPFGYMMVHFIEDSEGYAEKIYLDVSRGDDPEQWDPLNGGEPILASDLGTTGVRDPYLTYSPQTETYYIIATDLRVFGGDSGTGACTDWCHWSSNGSTKLNVWESTDLVTWSDLRQFDVATTADGVTHAELGMAWAPEATWVPDYHGDSEGAFVVYWSSNVYDDADYTGSTYSRVLWGATADFTQETYEYGGTLVDTGANTIDTTIAQSEGTTYRITKDNGDGNGIYMESTTAHDWWDAGTEWSLIQTEIGAGWAGNDPGGVEGPAVFKRHDDDHWYLYVDVIPTTGYRPMQTDDLDAGWTELHSDEFWMRPSTKHGGVVSLTKGQYDRIRSSDAVEAPQSDLGSVEVVSGAPDADVHDALPDSTSVTLAYGYGAGELPVDWDLSSLDTSVPGAHEVTGTVRSIGANLNDWVGDGGSTEWNAPNRELLSTMALRVTAEVVVPDAAPLRAAATTRCVAGGVVLVATVSNDGDAAANATVSTAYGEREVTIAPGDAQSSAFAARSSTIPAGEVAAATGEATATAPYDAADCS